MPQHSHKEPEEPIGIVISNGSREEVAPKFAAFVWAPAPDEQPLTVEVRAA